MRSNDYFIQAESASRRRVLAVLLGLTGATLFCGLDVRANAQKDKGKSPKAKGKPEGELKEKGIDTPTLVSAGISVSAAHAIFVELGLPRAGYKPLPPGIRKNLARGKPLPPGIARTRLPSAYLARLPAHPGYDWVAVGTDLVLISLATYLIADILHDVFR